ncbi:MAG TPA: HAMP domain-containing sensor histidine kinase [Pyrinomonadaceae bacterium]|jgi:signal transduction histidine kinase|nr:HAMP domain-containing sensor histidine kinase [Pyrinomonadaceae bacterium]
MSEQRNTAAGQDASGSATNGTGAIAADLHALSAEVVDLFYTQAFVPGEIGDEASICRAFSEMLLRHWDLCCLVIYLQADDGHFCENAIHTHPHLDAESALRVAKLLASVVEHHDEECQAWLDREEESDCDNVLREAREALIEANLRAGLAVPIHARGGLVGALVALSATPDQLRAAQRGLRFIAAPIVIAIGNARRSSAVREQRTHIEHLVEELQRRGDELVEANIELRRVNRYRSLFLARMSHELRTPLTSVLGFAEILLEHEDLSDSQRRFCEKIQNSGKQLQSSLNQLVDLSRLEAGQTELFLHEFSLRETLRESCAAVGRLAQKQEVTLDCCTAHELGTIVSDEGKLRQVLYNFLAHAIGRSPAGGSVRVRAELETPARFRVEILDEGEPLLDPSHIFEPVDLDAPNERGTNMNELGLVIAHRLLSVLGGAVKLDSGSTRGLNARLSFPIRPTESC